MIKDFSTQTAMLEVLTLAAELQLASSTATLEATHRIVKEPTSAASVARIESLHL